MSEKIYLDKDQDLYVNIISIGSSSMMSFQAKNLPSEVSEKGFKTIYIVLIAAASL